MKKVLVKEMAIYRHETQVSLLMSFWKVKLQGVVSFQKDLTGNINISEHFETSNPLT